jgi:anti-sigma factor RsiW
MPGSQKRVTEDGELLQRYLDGELTPAEASAFRERLAASPELQRELTELQLIGGLLRRWADDATTHAGSLLEPTLQRVEVAQQRRGRHASLGMALAAVLLLLLPSPGQGLWIMRAMPAGATAVALEALPPAAIERLEANAEQHAQVFVVGSASTPVVWLADDLGDGQVEQQDPG